MSLPSSYSNRLFIIGLIAALCAAILAIDLNISLGVAGGVPYLLPVFIASWLPGKRATILTAVLCSGLTLLGLYYSPPLGVMWQVLTNRALALFVIWTTAWFNIECKQAEETLRKSEERFDLAVKGSNDGLWDWDLESNKVWWSPRLYELFGYENGEIKPDLERFQTQLHPEDKDRTLEAIQAHLKDHTLCDVEYRMQMKSGDYRCFRTRGQAIWDAEGTPVRMAGSLRDITERKQAEETLQIHKHIVDTTDDMMAFVDTDYIYRAVNQQYIDAFQKGREEMIGHPVAEITGSDLFENKVKQRLDRCLAGETFNIGDWRTFPGPGDVYLDVNYSPYREADGEVTGVVISARDITKLKQAEEVLRRYQHIVFSSSDFLAYMDKDYRYQAVNESYLEAFNLPREELIGKPAEELLGKENFKPIKPYMERCLSGETINFETSLHFPAKGIRALDVHYDPHIGSDGVVEGIVINVRDVTERKRVEEEREQLLHDEGERVKELQCMYGVAESLRTRITLEESFQDVAELIPAGWHYPAITRGKLIFDGKAYVSEPFAETEWMQSSDIIVNGELRGSIEVYYLEECPELDEGPFMTEERNLINGMAGSISAAIERQQVEAEREHLEQQLYHAQRLKAVGQLTGGIAHDFNNLLGIILGNLELLGERLGDDAKAGKYLAAAIHSVQRGASLTGHLLAFSRKQILDPRPLDLNKLVREMDELLRRTLGETIDIETVCAGGLWPCFADKSQVESALLNLVLNARDAMPAGGKLTVETANIHLDEAYADSHVELSPGQYVMLAVTDTGTGMSNEVIKHAFEPFFTTKGVGEGTGLGLSMVYGFAKQSQGQINIYSEEGKGTTIKLYLPRSSAAAEQEEVAAEVEINDLYKGFILVVEDELPLLKAVTLQLEGLGHTVLSAQDGKTALQVFAENEGIDLLLTDVVLPGGMSGRNIAEELQKQRPNLKVVYMSGYAENAIIHDNRLSSDAVLLRKPFTLAELRRKLQAVLSS